MTDEALLRFCAANALARVEREPNGDIKVMSPTGNEGAGYDTDITLELGLGQAGRPRSRIQLECRMEAAGRLYEDGGCPLDQLGAIERGLETRAKRVSACMSRVCYRVAFGDRCAETSPGKDVGMDRQRAELGWLVDPSRKAVEIYRPGREPEVLEGGSAVEGEGPVGGFVLELGKVWG